MQITETEYPLSPPIQPKTVYSQSSFLIPESLANILEGIHVDEPEDKPEKGLK